MPEDAKIIELLIGIIIVLGGLGYRSLSGGLKEAHTSRGKLYDRVDKLRDDVDDKLEKLRTDMDDKFDRMGDDISRMRADLSKILGIMQGKGDINGKSCKR